MNVYDIGDAVKLSVDFAVGGVATNPTTTTLRIRKPNGTITTPAVTNPSTGRFEYVLTIDLSGIWSYRFEGTGAAVAAQESFFDVLPSLVLA